MSAARALELFTAENTSRADFSVEVWPDRGNAAIYKEGEKISFNFRAGRDSYVYLYLLDAGGDVTMLFPHGNENNFIRAGQVYTIPPKNLNLTFEAQPPYGTETLKVFSTISPIPQLRGRGSGDAHGVFKLYGDAARDMVNAIKTIPPGNIAAAQATFSVVK